MDGKKNGTGEDGINGDQEQARDEVMSSSSDVQKPPSSTVANLRMMIENPPVPPSSRADRKKKKKKKKKKKMKKKKKKKKAQVPGPALSSRIPSSLILDKALAIELHSRPELGTNVDLKKLRRTISNRLSSQKSREKKAHYEGLIEKKAKDLQKLVSALTPKIQVEKDKQNQMIQENESLQTLIEARTKEAKITELELEENRAELHWLQELAKTMNLGFPKDRLQNSRRTPVPSCRDSNSYSVVPTAWPKIERPVLVSAITPATAQQPPESTAATELQHVQTPPAPENLLFEEFDIDSFLNYEAIELDLA